MTNNKYEILDNGMFHTHSKASESYVHVLFHYPSKDLDVWVPVEYRRTGLHIRKEDTEELNKYLSQVHGFLSPDKFKQWKKDQKTFWQTKPNAKTTKSFFDELSRNVAWKCTKCQLPANPNWARRIQDIKEFGYTLATDTNRYCKNCKQKTTHLMLLPIPRVEVSGNGYETISPTLKKRILSILNKYDAFEAKINSSHLLPDHKFPEIRWDDDTKTDNPENMSEQSIKEKFQLLTNQRNLEKREVCRRCSQTSKRGTIFGIKFFYEGDENWDKTIPTKGKAAEKGCHGCPWYDIEEWRKQLLSRLKNSK